MCSERVEHGGTPASAEHDRAGPHRGWGKVFLVHLLLGPPIGGVLFVLIFFGGASIAAALQAGNGGIDSSSFAETMGLLLMLLLISIPYSYLFGGVQAAIVGAAAAVAHNRNGRYGSGLAFGASAAVGLGFVAVVGGLWSAGVFGFLTAGVGVAAALILQAWLNCRRPVMDTGTCHVAG